MINRAIGLVVGAMLPGLPFAFAQQLDSGAIKLQVQASLGEQDFDGHA